MIITDVPERDDHVSFYPFRTVRRARNFAPGDTIGPIGKYLQRRFPAHCAKSRIHGITSHAAVQAPIPRIKWRFDVRFYLINIIQGTSELVAELVTEITAGLQRIDPMILRQHRRADTITLSSGSRKEIRCGRLHE